MPTAVTAVRRSRPLAAALLAAAALVAGSSLPSGAHAAGSAAMTTGAHTTVVPTTVPVSPSAGTSQGIIMRDGGVCDPIRHMGC